jgi:hypothetical protein
MITILGERENYLLVTNGVQFTVVERCDGKFYGVRDCARRSASLDDAGVAELIREGGSYSKPEAQRLLADVATQWRDLLEHIR